jgi:hypothetical protein
MLQDAFYKDGDPLFTYRRRPDPRGTEAGTCQFTTFLLSTSEREGFPTSREIADTHGVSERQVIDARKRFNFSVRSFPNDDMWTAVLGMVHTARQDISDTIGRARVLGYLKSRGYLIPESWVDRALSKLNPARSAMSLGRKGSVRGLCLLVESPGSPPPPAPSPHTTLTPYISQMRHILQPY